MTHDLDLAARLSVAPMLDWTDRHCRAFHRILSRHALLYTEMITAPAIIHGDRARLLDFDAAEQPVALQLGGSDPAQLAQAVRIAADWGYAEINLNLGCPSDRVQAGCFGAALMAQPGLVGDCLAAMVAASPVPVTAKTRIGIDDQTPAEVLPAFLEVIRAAGVRRVIIHARKAWLQGLSPRENREVPPLDYPLVLAMKRAFPDLHISLNGGVADLAQVQGLLGQGLDGVMVGRAAYHMPMAVLAGADAALWGGAAGPTAIEAARAMRPYIDRHLATGGRLHQVVRHMLGLFHGQPGARYWRQQLSGQIPDRLDHYDAVLAAMEDRGAT
ncbi:tRNA dihydrouridine(20/20a) synthase DusA [Paracoccus sp. p3-h83]|uniref:tRNA dihydrouridine(20/20a) synthase DusA n=1 Tax=Paracoccus sp. p3-h83 TaxID=3342805 RepID=UPI0035BA7722